MITLEQGIRLRDAGMSGVEINDDRKDEIPDEKEMMEFLGNSGACVIVRCKDEWIIVRGEGTNNISHQDLTEALVQACVKVLEKDPDLGKIHEGHICKHGIRWPHECMPCADEAWKLHQLNLEKEGK